MFLKETDLQQPRRIQGAVAELILHIHFLARLIWDVPTAWNEVNMNRVENDLLYLLTEPEFLIQPIRRRTVAQQAQVSSDSKKIQENKPKVGVLCSTNSKQIHSQTSTAYKITLSNSTTAHRRQLLSANDPHFQAIK